MLLNEYITEYREQLQHRLDNPVYFSGLPMFHPDLDKAIRGLRKGEITFLSGGTATGKSSAALRTVAYNFMFGKLNTDDIVLYVTAEMSNYKVVNRLVSLITGIPGILLDTGDFGDVVEKWECDGRKIKERYISIDDALSEINHALKIVNSWSLDLQDRALPTTMDIVRWIKIHQDDGNRVPLVVIDHMGELGDAPPVTTTDSVYMHKSNAIKAIALDFDTHVLAIHDLDKVGTQKEQPNATNLKGSVMAQYRPDNIIIIKSEPGRKGQRYVTFLLDKTRHGAGYTGTFGPVMFAQPAGLFGIDIENSDIWRKYSNG